LLNNELVKLIRFPGDTLKTTTQYSNENIRKSILINSLKVTKYISPKIYKTQQEISALLFNLCKIEIFIKSDPSVQASCMPSNDTAIIILTSGLVKILTNDEIRFVIGHEAGHYIYKHFVLSDPNDSDSMYELKLKRAAEISSDRMGYLCLKNKENAYSAIMKIISGLGNEYISFNIREFLHSYDEIFKLDSDVGVYMTHPAFAVRLRALLWFEMSDAYYMSQNINGKAPLTLKAINQKITRDLKRIGDNVIEQHCEASIKRAKLWLAIVLTTEDGKISSKEKQFLMKEFDNTTIKNAFQYLEDNGRDAVNKKLFEKFNNIKHFSVIHKSSLIFYLKEIGKISETNESMLQNYQELLTRYLGICE